jgi:hypothetical protein
MQGSGISKIFPFPLQCNFNVGAGVHATGGLIVQIVFALEYSMLMLKLEEKLFENNSINNI